MKRLFGAAFGAALFFFAAPGSADTPNLDCGHIPTNPVQGEVTANAAFDCLDEGTQEAVSWTITGNETVTQTELAAGVLHVLGGTPSAFDFDLPAGVERIFALKNDSGATATVQVTGGGGASVEVDDGETFLLHSDGSDVVAIAGGALPERVYDIPLLAFDTPSAGDVLSKIVMDRAITIPADMSGGQCDVDTNPDGTYDIDLTRNGSSVGTISISTGGAATLTTASNAQQIFSAGDVLRFVAPDPSSEASIDGIACTIPATVN